MKKTFLTLLVAATLTSCDSLNKPETKDQPQEATRDTAVVYRNGQTAGSALSGAWDMTKAKLADVKFDEIKLPSITVRGDSTYNVYSLDEAVLFDTDKADIKPGAAAALEQITASIGQRSAGKELHIMGFADSRGDKNYNKELSGQRAESVKNWLVQTGKIEAARVSVEALGEAMPAATNATAEGRQENRRVEIAVRNR